MPRWQQAQRHASVALLRHKGAFQSDQKWPVPSWKHPAKGFLQNIKWFRGSPLASAFHIQTRDGLTSAPLTRAGFSLRGVKWQNLTAINSQQRGTIFWDTILQFSVTCARNICLIRTRCNAFYLYFQAVPCRNMLNLLLYTFRIVLPLGQILLSL